MSNVSGIMYGTQNYVLRLEILNMPDDTNTMFEFDNTPYERMCEELETKLSKIDDIDVEIESDDETHLLLNVSANLKCFCSCTTWQSTRDEPGGFEIDDVEVEDGYISIESEKDLNKYKSDFETIIKDVLSKFEGSDYKDLTFVKAEEIELDEDSFEKDEPDFEEDYWERENFYG